MKTVPLSFHHSNLWNPKKHSKLLKIPEKPPGREDTKGNEKRERKPGVKSTKIFRVPDKEIPSA